MRPSLALALALASPVVAGAAWSIACGGQASTPATAQDDGGGGTGSTVDGGGVGIDGGATATLLFAVVGDTRPPHPDDIGSYPTAIIDQIFQDIAGLDPQPQFVLGTGDYQYSSTTGGQAAQQLDLYLAARAKFPGPFYPTMGNHECTGSTDSNCGSGNADGLTDNYDQFMGMMLAPIQQTKPYYSIHVNAPDGSWTSKFVFVAANAWDAGQAAWFSQVMAQTTTYTFVVRHEESSATTAPGVGPSDQVMLKQPYTLLIVGHSHTYEHQYQREVLFGNGGAPLDVSNQNYGYGLFSRRADGAIVVDAMDYQTNKPDPAFHFVVNPDGSVAH
jgi:predicted phosphodiesterase